MTEKEKKEFIAQKKEDARCVIISGYNFITDYNLAFRNYTNEVKDVIKEALHSDDEMKRLQTETESLLIKIAEL